MNIEIKVETRNIPEQTDPVEHRYVFAYTITIANNGDDNVQLFKPLLVNHRCKWQKSGSSWRGRCWRATYYFFQDKTTPTLAVAY